jgi:hypothetical protein
MKSGVNPKFKMSSQALDKPATAQTGLAEEASSLKGVAPERRVTQTLNEMAVKQPFAPSYSSFKYTGSVQLFGIAPHKP